MTNAKALHWKDFSETNSSPSKICKFLNVICPCNSKIRFKLKHKLSGLCIELNSAGNTCGGWWIRSCKHLQKKISVIKWPQSQSSTAARQPSVSLREINHLPFSNSA